MIPNSKNCQIYIEFKNNLKSKQFEVLITPALYTHVKRIREDFFENFKYFERLFKTFLGTTLVGTR